MSEIKQNIEKKKEFTYRGKTINELKSMDIREFAKLTPSRERRAILRNTHEIENFISNSKKKIESNKQIKTHNRKMVIVPAMIGMTISVYNGRGFERVEIIQEMLGHRLGEFSITRSPVKHGAAGIGATRSSASRSVK
ncbi:MAG: 30S ribosomal protein S19 [Candidatus Pacearchaeota archaeon]